MSSIRILFFTAFFLFCLAIFIPPAKAQVAGEDPRFSEKSVADGAIREARIKEEIKSSKVNDWAGEYHYGDGLGINVFLMIAPKSGFTFTWVGCMGVYDRNFGDVVFTDDKITLVFTYPNIREGFQGIAPELVPVLWGERHYLIPANGFVRFANAINGGYEPATGFRTFGTSFLLKQGDKEKSAFGRPQMPAEFQHLLLVRPIRAKTVTVGESRIDVDGYDPARKNRITQIVVSAGRSTGAFVGMELHVISPSRIWETAIITKVGELSSEAEIAQSGLNEPAPSVNWKFSTNSHDHK